MKRITGAQYNTEETLREKNNRKQDLLSTNEKRLSTSNSLCSNLFIFLFLL